MSSNVQYTRLPTERAHSPDDDSDDEVKFNSDRSPHFWPRDLANASHMETGIVDSEGKVDGCVASANRSLRIGFLRKVLGIVSFQILLTIGICTAIYCIPGSQEFMIKQSWIVFPNLIGSLALMVALHLKAHEVPVNYILLAAFTTLQAVTLGCIVVMFKAQVILEAAVITGLVVAGLFAFTLQNKRDFSTGYAMGFSLLSVLMIASFMQIFLMSPAFNFVLNVAGAGIFSILLVLDLDMIMHRLSPEDYILACISLYMDIINLFIRILQIVNEANK